MKPSPRTPQQELDELRQVHLPAALSALEEANRQGDASQNPDSFVASEEISRINGRISYLLEIVNTTVDHPLPAGTVVTIDYGDGPEKYVMSASPGNQGEVTSITFRSPLGRALAEAAPGSILKHGETTAVLISIDLP